jgi:hypothetical protein
MNKTIKPTLPPTPKATAFIGQAIAFGFDAALVGLGKKRRMISTISAEKQIGTFFNALWENERISKNEAEELVGRRYLAVWEKNRLIKGFRKGTGKTSKIEYDRLELQRLQLSETYHYFMD